MRSRFVCALLLVAPLLFTLPAPAAGQARFGPMAGVNLAGIRGEDAGDFENKVGFLFGVYGQFDLSPRFALQPQLLYTMKGAQDSDNSDFKLNLNLIQVPVLAQLRFPGASNVTPYLIAGPAFAFKASCKFTDGNVDVDCDDIGEVSSTDLSLIGGVGLELGPNLTIAVRYDHGLTRLDKDPAPDDVFSRAFSLTIGYGVRLSPVR